MWKIEYKPKIFFFLHKFTGATNSSSVGKCVFQAFLHYVKIWKIFLSEVSFQGCANWKDQSWEAKVYVLQRLMFYIVKKPDILCFSFSTVVWFSVAADVLGHSRLAGLEHERLEDREADGPPRLHRLHLLVPHRLPGHHRRLRGPAHLTRRRQGQSVCI